MKMSQITKESKIETLGLEPRINRALRATLIDKIKTVGDLIRVLEEMGPDVLKSGQNGGIASFGRKSLDHVLLALEDAGFEIPERVRPWWKQRPAYRRRSKVSAKADEAVVLHITLAGLEEDLFNMVKGSIGVLEWILDRHPGLGERLTRALGGMSLNELARRLKPVIKAALLEDMERDPAEWRHALGLELAEEAMVESAEEGWLGGTSPD